MGKEIMRHSKNKRQAMGNLQKHNEAKKEHVEALQKSEGKNSDIVVGNLRYNEALVEPKGTYTQELNRICKENNIKPRKDAVTLISSVYGMSPEETRYLMVTLHIEKEEDTDADRWSKKKWRNEHSEWVDEYLRTPKEERTQKVHEEMDKIRAYAEDCVKFHENHYGEVIGAHVHFHESTPHIHIDSIPIYEDEKGWHLSAKEMIGNKVKLSKMQTTFHEKVGKMYGLERGEIKVDAEIKKHTSKTQWEKKNADKALAEAKKELADTKEALTEAKGELEQTREQVMEIYSGAEQMRAQINAEIEIRVQMMQPEQKNALKGKLERIDAKKKDIDADIVKKAPVPILFGKVKEYAQDIQKVGKIIREEASFEEDEYEK